MGWKVVLDSLGQTGLDSIRKKDHMFVIAKPKQGVLPGLKAFKLNNSVTEWYLNRSPTQATIRFIRKLPSGEIEQIQNLLFNDPFIVELTTAVKINHEQMGLSLMAGNQTISSDQADIAVRRKAPNSNTYRSGPIVLLPNQSNSSEILNSAGARLEYQIKPGATLKATVANSSWLNNGSPQWLRVL